MLTSFSFPIENIARQKCDACKIAHSGGGFEMHERKYGKTHNFEKRLLYNDYSHNIRIKERMQAFIACIIVLVLISDYVWKTASSSGNIVKYRNRKHKSIQLKINISKTYLQISSNVK